MELAEEVAALDGEIDVARIIEDQSMRIPGLGVGHLDSVYVTGVGVDVADVAGQVAGVVDGAVIRHDQVVRARPRLQIQAAEIDRLRVQCRHVMAPLSHEPDVPGRPHVGVARA